MKLEIIDIDFKKQVVTLIVLEDTNLKGYAITNKFRNIYAFPNQKVVIGDYIKIFSIKGKDESMTNSIGTTTYEFYWNRRKNAWSHKWDEGFLIKYEHVSRKKVANISTDKRQ